MEGESTTEGTVGAGEQTTTTNTERSGSETQVSTEHSTSENKPSVVERPKSIQDAIRKTKESFKKGEFVSKDALDNKSKNAGHWEKRHSRGSQQLRDGAKQNGEVLSAETPQQDEADTQAKQSDPPLGIRAQDRELFSNLTPEAQSFFLNYYETQRKHIEHQQNELGESRKALNTTYSTVAPLMEAVGEDGDWMEALKYTTKWATELIRNPEEGVLRFLMQHNLTPDALMAFAAKAEEMQRRAPRKGPEVLAAENEVRKENEQLKKKLEQYNLQDEEAAEEESQSLVKEFNTRLSDWANQATEAGKPKYPYLQYTEVEPYFWDELERVKERVLQGELIPERAFDRAYKLALQVAREENDEFDSFMKRQEEAQKLRPFTGQPTSSMRVSTNIKPVKPQSMAQAVEMTRKQLMRR
jgi:hypothetical protein